MTKLVRYLAAFAALAAVVLIIRWIRASGREHRAEIAQADSEPDRPLGQSSRREPSRNSSPPKLLSPQATKTGALQSDPSAADYDPIRLMQAGDGRFRELFLAEPKNPKWSTQMERRLNQVVSADIEAAKVPATIVEMDCRTAICRIVFEAEDLQKMNQANLILQYTPLGSALQSDKQEPSTAGLRMGFFIAFDPKTRDLERWDESYPMIRRAALARRRAEPLPPGYPAIPPP